MYVFLKMGIFPLQLMGQIPRPAEMMRRKSFSYLGSNVRNSWDSARARGSKDIFSWNGYVKMDMHMQGRSQLSTKDYEKLDSWTLKTSLVAKNRWDMQTWGFMIDIFWRLEGLGVKTAQNRDVLKFLPAENDEFQVQFIFLISSGPFFSLKFCDRRCLDLRWCLQLSS